MKERDWPLREILMTARKAQGLSQADAAERAGYSSRKWQQIELGYFTPVGGQKINYDPSDDDLLSAANAVEVDARELFQALGRPVPKGTRVNEAPEVLITQAVALLTRGLAKVEQAGRQVRRARRATG